MADLLDSKFTKFSLTEQELKIAATFVNPDLTRQWLQTLQAEAAEVKLATPLDTTNFNKYIQESAYLDGQIDTLQMLLDAHNLSLSLIKE